MTLLSHTVVFLLWMGCTTCKTSAGAACEYPPLIDFGEIVSVPVLGYKESDRVQYACNPGYTLSGSEWVTCHEKIWVPGPPQCLAPCTITRQQLEAQNLLLSNGQRRTFLIQSGRWQKFMCIAGFKLTDSPIKQCFNGRMELPSCITEESCLPPQPIECADVPRLENKNLKIEKQGKTMYLAGARLKYVSRSGYTLEGPSEITCSMGNWTSSPACLEMPCGSVPKVANAQIEGRNKETYEPGETIRYQCDAGFLTVGPPEIICREGNWTAPPVCEGKGGKCGPPPVIENGDILSFRMQEYPQGATLEYKCPSLYVLEGSRYISCTNGRWTNPPVCLVACTASEEDMARNNIELKWVEERKLYSRSGDIIEFQCKTGYLADPASSPFRAQCVDGTLEYPRCKPEIVCTASEEDMARNNIELKWVEGRKLYSRSGDTIEFRCKRGYLADPASSPFRAQCVDGTLEYPQCKPGKNCTVRKTIMDRNYIKLRSSGWSGTSTYLTGDYIHFECKWWRRAVSLTEAFTTRCVDGVIKYPECE